MIHSPDELVDVIDSDNRVIGQKLKVDAHRDGDLHRCVVAELVNGRGDYCFVRQAGDRQDAGQFVSPVGGHVSAGESVESALIRESREEIGITPENFRLIGTTIYRRRILGRDENHLFPVYVVRSDFNPVINHESVEYRWFGVGEIQASLRSDPALFGDAWHHVFKNLFPEIYRFT
jgi:isopentenyl-diphosphate delta-isomerase